ncbi:MAG: hypothetical protein AB7F29_00200 [Candidatus Nitrosocosmicus sp.]
MDYRKFTVWVFPGKNKKFNGKISLYEKRGGILILFGDVSLLDEFTDNRSMPGQEKIKKNMFVNGEPHQTLHWKMA